MYKAVKTTEIQLISRSQISICDFRQLVMPNFFGLNSIGLTIKPIAVNTHEWSQMS